MAEAGADAQTILVADSEVLIRHAIADYLRGCGYVVIEAASSDEAAVVLEERSLAIVAMLCDVKVQGTLSCFQLRAWLKQHRPGVTCILAGNVEGAAQAAAEICDDGPHLARPYDPQGVVDLIKRLLAGRDRTRDGR